VESELLLSGEARLSLLGRPDQQSQADAFNDPGAGRPFEKFTGNRLPDMNVVGVRWAASF
jgi:hypothetical protein